MKASIKFRDEQAPLMRAKVPLNILNLPFQSGVSAGESKELSLNLSTFFDSGPSLKFSYRPNDSHNPFSFVFKTGIGNFGSPNKSPLTMSAEFNLIGNQNPSFFIHFKPDFGDFSLKKSHSSGLVKGFGEKLSGGAVGEDNFINNGYLKGTGFLPVTVESKAAAGQALGRLVKGTEMSAKTAMPLRDFAVVNCRWGLRFPPQEAAMADEMDAVVVGRKGSNRMAGIRLPLLVMNKIGIEHVSKSNSKGKKSGGDDTYENLGKMCTEVKKQLEVIQGENGLLSKALSELRSDMAAGKMEFLLSDPQREKYPRSSGDKKSLSAAAAEAGKEANNGLKGAQNK
ncbi:uncharacterized protein LOC127264171 [Andrographis paniculata]|uniref:uncharacterized protein LOC127264171 n=1 Tax=Andrographis paniculata TaxID=175694 RepID=UPI0021E73BD0|nr:uncharacterized protein LOC127264171 [Andrographis paniculata]